MSYKHFSWTNMDIIYIKIYILLMDEIVTNNVVSLLDVSFGKQYIERFVRKWIILAQMR